MKPKFKFFYFFIFLASILLTDNQAINAQGGSSPSWHINLNGGTSLFFGDVKQYRIWPVSNYENEWRLAAGLNVARQFSPVFTLRGQGLYGQLSGTRRNWNRYFESDYFEFNLNGVVNLNNLFGNNRDDRFMNFYLTAGIGLMNYNTTLYTLDTKKKTGSVGNGNGKGIGGRTLEGILTGGLGIDFRLSDNFSITLESANRIMNSDKLDDWVSGFPYDVYNYTSLGVTYRFGFSKQSNKGISPASYKRSVPQEQYEAEPEQKPKTEVPSVKEEVPVPVPVEPPKEKPVEVVIPPKEKVSEPEPEVVVVHEQPVQRELEYRVQIRARYNRPLSKSYLSNKYNIPVSDIKEDMHNGYYIYTVGSYDTYEEARTERNRLRTQNGVTDAFVVAFKNGQRLDKLP